MSPIIINLLSIVLALLYINVGLVNGQGNLAALLNQIGQEYVHEVAPCKIIRNAYNNYKDEMTNFRNIQEKCKSTPRAPGLFHQACEFLTQSAREENSCSPKQKFIRRVYFAFLNAVRDIPFGQLKHMIILNGLVTLTESADEQMSEPAKAVCQHWLTTADLCRNDRNEWKWGSYERTIKNYTHEKMNKVLAACQALGLSSTLGPSRSSTLRP